MGTSNHQQSIAKKKHVAFKYVCIQDNTDIKHPEGKADLQSRCSCDEFPMLPAFSREVLTQRGHQKYCGITWELFPMAEKTLISRTININWNKQGEREDFR